MKFRKQGIRIEIFCMEFNLFFLVPSYERGVKPSSLPSDSNYERRRDGQRKYFTDIHK